MNAFRYGNSKLYYQIYQKGSGKADIIERATKDVMKHIQENALPTEFGEASWVMVITWVRLRHWYSEWQENIIGLVS